MAMRAMMKKVLKKDAPSSSPTARLETLFLKDENVEKRSGAPFPSAAIVTPATDSGRLRYCEMKDIFGQKC